MRVNRLSKVTIYSRVIDLVIAKHHQYYTRDYSSLSLTANLEVVPQLGFAPHRSQIAVAGAGRPQLTSMNVASALEA